MIEKYCRTEDVADHFQVSTATVRAWVRMGAIPKKCYIAVDKTFRYKLTEVVDALVNMPHKNTYINADGKSEQLEFDFGNDNWVDKDC